MISFEKKLKPKLYNESKQWKFTRIKNWNKMIWWLTKQKKQRQLSFSFLIIIYLNKMNYRVR